MHSHTIPSPLGDLIAVASETRLILLEFADSKGLEKKISDIARSYSDVANQWQKKDSVYWLDRFMLRDDGNNKILKETELQLGEYFAGTRKSFTLTHEPVGTDFQLQSWKALQKIPYGETRSYKEEAILAWNPKAVRAIGWANNKNPIVIIIPCHRVIGASGDLIGYGWGLERKKWLLDLERWGTKR